MANTTGRIPLWLIGTAAGIIIIVLVGIFFHGSYSGLSFYYNKKLYPFLP